MKAKLVKTGQDYILYSESKETLAISNGRMVGKILSIKNCQAIENGYDLDELIKDESSFMSDDTPLINKIEVEISFMRGFKKALEILGDKKYSEEDVLKELNKLNTMPNSILDTFTDDGEMVTMKWFEQSLQQTEWYVSVEIEQLVTFTSMPKEGEKRLSEKPKLDSNGCLILKRI